MLVALAVPGLEAVGLDRQLYSRLGFEIERPFVALEVALTVISPQKCGTWNSMLERAGSSRQAPVARSLTEGVDGVSSIGIS